MTTADRANRHPAATTRLGVLDPARALVEDLARRADAGSRHGHSEA
jgi:hypothetical protein